MDWTAVAAICAVLGVLTVGLRMAHTRLLKPLVLFLRQWFGEPELRGAAGQLISEARPGVMERLETHDEQIAEIRQIVTAQLTSNGGSSLVDKAARTVEILEGSSDGAR